MSDTGMIRIVITKTWKSYSPRAEWESYDRESHFFDTIAEAKTWIRENVPTGKRHAVYQDTKSRGTIRNGWIVGFRVNDYDHYGKKVKHLEQWWIVFERVISHPTENRKGEVESVDIRARA